MYVITYGTEPVSFKSSKTGDTYFAVASDGFLPGERRAVAAVEHDGQRALYVFHTVEAAQPIANAMAKKFKRPATVEAVESMAALEAKLQEYGITDVVVNAVINVRSDYSPARRLFAEAASCE